MIVKDPEVGEKYRGKVVGIQSFGAFISLMPGKDGLLHISRMANGRIGKVEDVLNLGDEVDVTVLEVDDNGKVSLDRLDKPDAPEGSWTGGGGGSDRDRPRRSDHGPRGTGDGRGDDRRPRRHH
jgi:polyribonucleotide nucleotidyltransferase